MTNIYFVRHAEPNYDNHYDAERELTAKGLEDRKLVTKFFEDKAVDIVLSSPYKRAIDTVREFADKYGYEIEKVDDFERIKKKMPWIVHFKFNENNECVCIDYIDVFSE